MYKTIEEDEKTRTYIFKRRKEIEEKEEREGGRVKESRKREKGGEETCRSLVDDDPAWPVPDRSFERNIKINNISTVRYRYYYRAGAVYGVHFGSYGGLISRDPILDSILVRPPNTRLCTHMCINTS